MKPYELTVLLHPDLELDVDAPISKIEKMIDAADGKVTKRDNWGKKRLAYRLKKHTFAVYIYFEVNLPVEKVRQLEGSLLITEEVIRFLIVSKLATKPKADSKERKPNEELDNAAVAAREDK